ncbi:MAG: hypothetical protein ACT4OV_00750 [Microthrixaceae bacterium]
MTDAMYGRTSPDADLLDPWPDGLDDDGDERLEGDDGDGAPPADPAARAQRDRVVRLVLDALVITVASVVVFASIHPADILSSAVPAGGDMGAHVWGPAFLRDHLLPEWRLSGWTPDWYAGFPAYQFYMVLPSLLIVALDVGFFGGWTMVVPLAGAGLLARTAWRRGAGWARRGYVTAAVVVALLGVELPYGTAFKLVTILGLVTLPVAAYAFGRLADLPFPGPAMLAIATVPFLFDRNFTIYGGNVASTLAGEFAFSISLSLCVLFLGVVVRGLRTGRHRALAAVLLALTGLNHLIPAFYAIAGTAVIALFALTGPALSVARNLLIEAWAPIHDAARERHGERRSSLFGRVVALAVLTGRVVWSLRWLDTIWRLLVAPLRFTVRFWRAAPAARWLATVMPVGGLISAFWVLPFFWQRAYVNDMGWEKLPYLNETIWKYLVPRRPDMVQDIRWVLTLALVGLVLSLAFRVRLGWILAGIVIISAVAFAVMPQGRLWNARVLPLYYLGLYLLAAIGVSELGRTIAVLAARDPERPGLLAPVATTVAAVLGSLVLVGMPLRSLPFGSTRADGSYSFLGLSSGVNDASFVRSWARWNYTGYVGKDAYAEYRALVTTMERVGREHGCGRSFWEYEKELNRYGTPMALMLLPHWSDGCIGSMEGLFFEASATTPFHFLTQVELSAAPSAAQRDLPYDGFDLSKGIEHLQLMGVRYYLASSVQATTAARADSDLTEIATSGPWVIFQVADSPLVEPLANEPAVLDGVDDAQHDWICRTKDDRGRCNGPAVAWFKDAARWDVYLASSGPRDWQRVSVEDPRPRQRAAPSARVTNIETTTDRISFDVDRLGTPVLVKASYFPNWHAKGADGPYRVAPNLMVVVPSERHVDLRYGREPVEWIGYALTALGIALAALLASRRVARD